MTTFPLDLVEGLGHWGSYIVYLGIGIAFGIVLELSGFGNSKKLAAQFYFKDMTVLKVMFTAIVVAMVLLFFAIGLGLLDYNLIWVNPTYLWPGIVGGLIMGAGFIIGGFCPGTSLVAAATLKLDGVFFVMGAFFGIFVFGETVGDYEKFWNSSYMGRFTLQEWLGIDTGVLVLIIVLGAVVAFWGGEKLEQIFGDKETAKKAPKWRYAAAGAIVLASVGLVVLGQPTTEDKWEWISDEKAPLLANRDVQIHPGELLDLTRDRKLQTILIDVRDEADFNRFHLVDAQHVPLSDLPDRIDDFHEEPANTVFVVMSNDEAAATQAWKTLVAESVPNAYILEGGVNGWLDIFVDTNVQNVSFKTAHTDDELAYAFSTALGSRHPAANPNLDAFDLTYVKKVKLEAKRGATSGGCG